MAYKDFHLPVASCRRRVENVVAVDTGNLIFTLEDLEHKVLDERSESISSDKNLDKQIDGNHESE